MIQEDLAKKLKIAVMWHDGVVLPHPPVTRSLKELVKKLQCLPGVEVVEWKPYQRDMAWKITVSSLLKHGMVMPLNHLKASLYFLDGGKQLKELINVSDEPWLPLSTFSIKDNEHVKERTLPDIEELVSRRDKYTYEYNQRKFFPFSFTSFYVNIFSTEFNRYQHRPNRDGDVILCPAAPSVAPVLGTGQDWCCTASGICSITLLLFFPSQRSIWSVMCETRGTYQRAKRMRTIKVFVWAICLRQ